MRFLAFLKRLVLNRYSPLLVILHGLVYVYGFLKVPLQFPLIPSGQFPTIVNIVNFLDLPSIVLAKIFYIPIRKVFPPPIWENRGVDDGILILFHDWPDLVLFFIISSIQWAMFPFFLVKIWQKIVVDWEARIPPELR